MTASVATISPRDGRPQLSIDVRGEDDLRSPGGQKTPLYGNDGVMAMDFETEEDTSSTTTYEYDEDEENNINNDDAANNGGNGDVDVLVLEADAEPTTENQGGAEAVVASPSSGDISMNTEIEMIKTESGSSCSNTGKNTAIAADLASQLANFITQTDASGKASTPRSAPMNSSLTQAMTVASPSPSSTTSSTAVVDIHDGDQNIAMTDVACETIITAFDRMCCCIDPAISTTAANAAAATQSSSSSYKGSMTRSRVANEYISGDNKNKDSGCSSSSKVVTPSTAVTTTTTTTLTTATTPANHPIGYSTRGHDATPLLEGDSALYSNPNNIKLLPSLDIKGLDSGKKCLVLDLDETLVHSSFRAVKGADFVLPVHVRSLLFSSSIHIPTCTYTHTSLISSHHSGFTNAQIEDVVHFVYVTKRPGVDTFLLEMSKHYEIIIYTASLNKYADALLNLLDTNRVIRTRLFRESCVYYEGNYIKDLALLNRPLDQTIIIDNSPASYMFHPENAIDCGSFIDDPKDVELEQIGQFLIGLKDVSDVRGTVNLWRHWPNIDLKTKKTS